MTNPTGSFDVTHHPDKGYFPTLDSIKESSWTDGTPDLSGQTIDTLVRSMRGINRLGNFTVAESVPYPVLGQDVVEALKYILEHNFVEEYISSDAEDQKEGVSSLRTRRYIPISSKSEEKRDTPHIELNLSFKPNGIPLSEYRATLYVIDKKGKAHQIVEFCPFY